MKQFIVFFIMEKIRFHCQKGNWISKSVGLCLIQQHTCERHGIMQRTFPNKTKQEIYALWIIISLFFLFKTDHMDDKITHICFENAALMKMWAKGSRALSPSCIAGETTKAEFYLCSSHGKIAFVKPWKGFFKQLKFPKKNAWKEEKEPSLLFQAWDFRGGHMKSEIQGRDLQR